MLYALVRPRENTPGFGPCCAREVGAQQREALGVSEVVKDVEHVGHHALQVVARESEPWVRTPSARALS
jgi:hypothetical protein